MKPFLPLLIHVKKTAKYGRNGFSLVEMMIVVSILAIIAAAAVPSFTEWIANTKTRSVAEAIQNGLQLAQGEAVKRGVQVQFVLTNAAPITKGVAASTTGKNWVIQTMQLASPATVDAFVQGASLESATSSVSANAATMDFPEFSRHSIMSKLNWRVVNERYKIYS